MSKYSVQARTCIKGESFFESLIAEYAIPHQVIGQKDIGVDYICEWAYEEEPSGILFAVQVKTFTVDDDNKLKSLGITDPRLNALEAFSISNSNLVIKQPTLEYWKGLGLPTYLFVVANWKGEGTKPDEMRMFYKRFTPVLTGNSPQADERFYRVDIGARFRAFADEVNQTQGFARDLFVDLMRWSYYKGNISWMSPRRLGLRQFPEKHNVFHEFFEAYKPQICETYKQTKEYLEKHCGYGSTTAEAKQE
jgi:hypothetical protein